MFLCLTLRCELVVCRCAQVNAALTYDCYVNGPPEDPTDSMLHFLSVTEIDACVEHIDQAELQQTIVLTGLSFLLRHSTQNLLKPKNRKIGNSFIHSFIYKIKMCLILDVQF